ncbi:hypothetical protein H5407_09915 [Mitsuaria sp. WAJ17]|uniref:type IV pilus assembly protein FimV n=1 Tax=Mitsuaria sp. WAJ17 TaxID=2761452 RepID=UPI00160237F5|nr:hypothetical protein [Mitsuaria sp. WAJ17]MBB2485540.1 hypothetical protein [Mitsuaria sp. WAJ17]
MRRTTKPETPDPRSASPWLAVLGLGLVLAMPASALTVGAPQTHSALFQPLRLVFPIQLLPGESLGPECVRAVLVAGETRLATDQVQVQLLGRTEGEVNAVRVSSLVPIDEPMVNVSLSLGCPTRYTRQFTALIDPPAAVTRSEPPPVMLEGDELYSPALRAALATPGSRASDLLAPGRTVPVPEQGGGSAAAPTTQGVAPTKPAASRSASASQTRARPKEGVRPDALPQAEVRGAAVSMPAVSKAPRLQLEAPELLSAASTPAAASEAAQAQESQQRVKQLETELARVRAEAREVQDTLKQLTAQLRQPQGHDRSWLLMLAGISLLLAVACTWLFMQLQSLRRATHEAWWAHMPEPDGGHPTGVRPTRLSGRVPAAEAGPTPTVNDAAGALQSAASAKEDDAGQDFLNSDLPPMDEDTEAAPFTHALPPSDEGADGDADAVSLQLLDMPQANTDLQPLQALPERAVAEGVSVEELIDLEQQVDFFMVLGQQEAAVELLSQRLHEKGRHTALPYLKLLEILQRHGDQAGFERVAGEFSERFHAQAPVWSDDIAAGEGLLAYAQATELIVQSWRDAAMTMQLIQTLLAHGDPDGRAFNLAAYRDILMLYAVARDISEHEVRGEDIDLFLPLDAGRQGSPTSMMATMPFQRTGGPAPAAGPVDLDLDLSRGDATR